MNKYFLILLIFSFSTIYAKTNKNDKINHDLFKIVKVDDKYAFKIINADKGTFGYDILSNNKVMIHQPNIPAVSGNMGFKEVKEAEKVAKFVIFKLKNNIMPPSVTPQEIDSLKAIK